MIQRNNSVSDRDAMVATPNSTWLSSVKRHRLKRNLLRISTAMLMIVSAGIALRTSSFDARDLPSDIPIYLLLIAIVPLVADALVFKWFVKP